MEFRFCVDGPAASDVVGPPLLFSPPPPPPVVFSPFVPLSPLAFVVELPLFVWGF